jgi:antirestriction protein ArdC
MNEKVRKVLNTIVDKFKSGEIPEAVAMASYPLPDIPSAKWSFMNRTIMFLCGTGDARGYRQWQEVNRFIKKGAKAIHIIVPCFKKVVDEKTGEEKESLRYFKATPVFMMEDTDGEKLDYETLELPELPLIEKAKEWGISIKAVPGSYLYRGYYSPVREEIGLATPEEKTFFHELAHASHEKVKGKLKTGQDPFQEIVAELSAQALCHLVGKRTKETLGNSYQYIERYAIKMKLSPYSACLKVLSETEKVLDLILKGGNCHESAAKAA